MGKKKKIIIKILICFLILFSACQKNPYKVDISEEDLQIHIKRFEVDLFSMDLDSVEASIPGFYDKYGDFFDLFNYRIINIGGAGQRTYPEYLKIFLTDYLNYEVYKKTMEIYPDVDDLEEELTIAFRHYHHYFPENQIPDILTFISRFNQSVVIAEGIIGIGLDKYLGSNEDYYKKLGLSQYMIHNMHRDKIPSDCMMALALSDYEYNDSVDNLISDMIYNGQIMFYVKSMLPHQPDSLIMGFSDEEMNFCLNNEAGMWEYLVENKLLFETDRMTIRKFTGVGPFTKDFTSESPARAAVWIGWRIVEAYSRKNPHIGLKEIMNEKDYQKILTISEYNP